MVFPWRLARLLCRLDGRLGVEAGNPAAAGPGVGSCDGLAVGEKGTHMRTSQELA